MSPASRAATACLPLAPGGAGGAVFCKFQQNRRDHDIEKRKHKLNHIIIETAFRFNTLVVITLKPIPLAIKLGAKDEKAALSAVLPSASAAKSHNMT